MATRRPLVVIAGNIQELPSADSLDGYQPIDATLTAIAALDATAGLLVQTAADTFVRRTLAAPAAGFSITNPAGTAGNPTFILADDLAAVEGLATTGIVRRTGSSAWSAGTTVATTEIADDAVTYAKVQNISATDKLLGRVTAGAGNIEEITCTAFARTLLDDTTAAVALVTLGASPLASPTFTGAPAAPTAAVATNTTQVATTAFVMAEIANDAAPIAHVGAGGTAHANAVAAGAAGFMTGADKTKLDGVAAGATANVGTVTGVTGTAPVVSSGGAAPAISMAAATATVNGYMTSTYASKLDGIAAGANDYAHPANHLPSIISQDASNRFVTDAEKTVWTAKEPAITTGTTAQYLRGDKSLSTFATDALAAAPAETVTTIKAALGITTLSGSNTGDQTSVSGNAGTVTNGLYTTNKDASGGVPGLTLFKINFKNALNTFTSFFTNDNTAARTYTFPDKDGTVAMTSDITGTNSGTNTGDNAINSLYSGLVSNATHTGDATGSTALTVVKINGTSMAGLATGILKNTTATGVPSIAAAGDFPTLNQSTTGSAATLTTPRAIYGNNFNGSAALTQVIASTYGGTGNGFAKFTGPATSEKIYTLPNATCSILTSNDVVTVTQGGTGRATSTTAYGLLAAGTTATGAHQTLAAGATTELLVGGGAAALPVWTAATGSGAPVRATSPSLVTPTLGVASATTINKVTLTAPVTGSTLTVADGKTLTASNTLTLTGTDGSSAAFGAGGTVAYTANKLSAFAATTSAELAGVISDGVGASGGFVRATGAAIDPASIGTTAPGSGVFTSLRVVSPSSALGYDPGSGGQVTQTTSKSTSVTLNKPSGWIFTHAATLAAGAFVEFNFVNSLFVGQEILLVSGVYYYASPVNYKFEDRGYSGVATHLLRITNVSATDLSQVLTISFVLISAAAN